MTQPVNGTATITSDGRVAVTPATGFRGTLTFTYTVCDPGGRCADATVVVTVVNEPPVVRNLSAGGRFQLAAGQTPPPLDLSDPEGDGAVVAVIAGALPPGLTLRPDGVFEGTATVPGRYEVTIEICDTAPVPSCTTEELEFVVPGIAPPSVPPDVPPTDPDIPGPDDPTSPGPVTPGPSSPGPISPGPVSPGPDGSGVGSSGGPDVDGGIGGGSPDGIDGSGGVDGDADGRGGRSPSTDRLPYTGGQITALGAVGALLVLLGLGVTRSGSARRSSGTTRSGRLA